MPRLKAAEGAAREAAAREAAAREAAAREAAAREAREAAAREAAAREAREAEAQKVPAALKSVVAAGLSAAADTWHQPIRPIPTDKVKEGAKYFGGNLLEYLQDPNIGVIKHSGCGGIGRWRIAKHAAEMAMECHLFDVLIWLELSPEDHMPRNLQRRIAQDLGIEFSTVINGLEDSEDNVINEDIKEAIHDKLKNKRFLLVLGDVLEYIDLTWVGVPSTLKTRWKKMRTTAVSKVVFVTTLEGTDFKIEYDQDFSVKHCPREIVEEEAAEAAQLLKRSAAGSYLTTDTVLDFLIYPFWININTSGVTHSLKRLIRYSMAEGFIINTTAIAGNGQGRGMNKDKTTEEEMILSERVMEPLFKELYDRSFIDENHQLSSNVKDSLKEVDKCRIGEVTLPVKDQNRDTLVHVTSIVANYNSILPSSPGWRNITVLFIKCEKFLREFDIPPTFFDNMQTLRVLELHFVPITSLPSSLSSLSDLRLLGLHGCKKLTELPASMQCLNRLEFLELSECTCLQTTPEQTFEQMSNLRHLDLPSSNITSLPRSISNLSGLQFLDLASCTSLIEIEEKSFENMQHLEVLDLSNSSSLKSLPSSLSNLVSLKQLYLTSCTSLKTGLGARVHLLKNLSSLKVLDLSYCNALEDIQDLSFEGLAPNIKRLDLSGLRIPKQLSFRGCQRLENLKLFDHENLEVLNLSGTTQLKDLSFRMSNITPPLRCLEMLPINYGDTQDPLIFQGLNRSQNDVGALVWVTEPQIFTNVSKQVFDAKCFSQFHIRVSSSIEEKPNMPMPMGTLDHGINFRSIYKQINSNFQTHRFSNFHKRTYDRHLEIYKCKAPLAELGHDVLPRAKLLTLFDSSSIDHVIGNSWQPDQVEGLKECRIGSCQNIKALYEGTPYKRISIFGSLEVIWVSDLPRLTVLATDYNTDSFAFLKHVHLEWCPKLKTVFTSSCHLNALETLEIKFCSRLEYAFHDSILAETSLQRLESLCLWELPKLKRICEGHLPKLQKMRVRGCRKLTTLPLGVGASYDASTGGSDVEIEGELDWWNHLQWADHATKDSIRFRPWHLLPFTLPTKR